MLKNRMGKLGVAGAMLALAGILSACSPGRDLTEEELAQGHKFRPEYSVELTTHRHLVPVAPGQVAFVEQQQRDLFDFLVGVGAHPGDRVVIAARRSRLEHRGDIVRFVRELGLVPDLRLIKDQKLGEEGDGYDAAILIQFERYVTKNPECGKWNANDFVGRYNNINPPNFGCSNTAMLQQQIVFPQSLIAGETLAFPEGDVAAGSVSRYRGRQVQAPKSESSKSN